MSFNITSGPTATAQKVVLYGVEGIGKSTFASHFPNPIFIDVEGSTSNMDVKRYPTPQSWQMLMDEIEDLKQNKNYQTLVIDTADWAEGICKEHLMNKNNWDAIDASGYGVKFVALSTEFGKILNQLSDLVELGINVVVNAHTKMKKKEEPDQMGAYDRYQLKMEERTSALLKEWADMLLFANYETTIVTDSKTQSKKATGGKRVMYATHHPAWDAKNRHGLPDKLPLEFSAIAHIFQKATPTQHTVAEQVPPTQATPMVETPQENQFAREPIILNPGIDPALAQLMTSNEVTEEEVQAVVLEQGWMPVGVAVKDYPADLVQGGLVANWDMVMTKIKEKRNY